MKFVKSEFGWDLVNAAGEHLQCIWNVGGVSKWMIDYPKQYFVHLKDAKEALLKRFE